MILLALVGCYIDWFISHVLTPPQVGLNIDPLALRPGAAPVIRPTDEKSVSFEEPVQVNPLESLTKV